MKRMYTLAFYAIIIISLGNSAGAGLIQNQDYTGSPLSSTTCSSCHNGGNFAPDPVIEVLESGSLVNAYIPGQTYEVRITINSSNSPGGYGFQMVALNSEGLDGGAWGAAPTDTRTIRINNRRYFEHARRLAENSYSIDWTAPATGAGDIGFYAVGNAVNANGGTSGDAARTAFLNLVEDPNVATVSYSRDDRIRLFPVPVVNDLTIEAEGALSIDRVDIFDLSGRQVLTSPGTRVINLELLNPATYIAIVHASEDVFVKRFMKL